MTESFSPVAAARRIDVAPTAAPAARRVAWVASHPVQYQAPLYRELSLRGGLDLHVFYASRHGVVECEIDPEFSRRVVWDVPLLGHHAHTFLHAEHADPAISTWGLDAPGIGRALERFEPDVVVVAGWNRRLYWRTIAWARRRGVPVLLRGDSTLLGPRAWGVLAAKAVVYPAFLRAFDGFLVPGRRAAEYLRRYGVPEQRLFTAPHSVDNRRFASAAKRAAGGASQDLRVAIGAHPDQIVFLFVGKLVDRKRPFDLLRAFDRAAPETAHLVFVGDGPLAGDIAAAAANCVRVHSLGFRNQSELPVLYAAADVLALPSDGSETWGLVANEAMACGCAGVLSRGCGAAADLVVDGVTGHSFEVGDVVRLGEILAALAGDASRTREMGAAARRHLEAYSVDRTADGVVAAIDAVVTR